MNLKIYEDLLCQIIYFEGVHYFKKDERLRSWIGGLHQYRKFDLWIKIKEHFSIIKLN